MSQRISIYFNHCHSFKPTTMKSLKQHSFRICGLYDSSLTDALNQTVSLLLHFLFATGLFSTESHNQPLILPTLKHFRDAQYLLDEDHTSYSGKDGPSTPCLLQQTAFSVSSMVLPSLLTTESFPHSPSLLHLPHMLPLTRVSSLLHDTHL